jgi:hypothetical protein
MERVDRKMVKFRSLKKASQDGMQRRGTIQISSRKLLFYAILFSLFFALLWMIAKPYFGMRYNYELGQIVQENIVSTKDITYINAKETEKYLCDRFLLHLST